MGGTLQRTCCQSEGPTFSPPKATVVRAEVRRRKAPLNDSLGSADIGIRARLVEVPSATCTELVQTLKFCSGGALEIARSRVQRASDTRGRPSRGRLRRCISQDTDGMVE